MDSRLRSERFEPPMSFLRAPASIDRDFALDQDVGPDEADLPPDSISEEKRSLEVFGPFARWLYGLAWLSSASCLPLFGGMSVPNCGPTLKGGWLSRQDRAQVEAIGLSSNPAPSQPS
jgi:hypothetical protein